MWFYKNVSRADFEKRKDFVEQIMQEFGCEVVELELPYENKLTSYVNEYTEVWISERSTYKFKNGFYRISEVLFPDKPFIVLEFGETTDEVKRNIMEDCEPFPYDLSNEETVKEIGYSLGIEPYPQDR